MSGVSGQLLCARQFQNSLDESSLEEVKAAIRTEPWLSAYYDLGEKYIRSKDGRISYAFKGLERNVNSLKSMSGLLLAWIDEAEDTTEEAFAKLMPTIRGSDDAELWVTWNPERDGSPVDKRYRKNAPDDARIVEINYRDNPWFPAKLEKDRLDDLESRPDDYSWIWEGEYRTAVSGAYFQKQLAEAKRSKRIGKLSADPLMETRAYWDIGGTGARADATSVWIAQFVGRELRVLDYYEAQGQPLAAHVNWLRENGYKDVTCVLPHDGTKHDAVFPVTYEGALGDAGFNTIVVPNQGAGAALQRIEAARRVFPNIWFNEDTTDAGRKALAWYHEKRDEKRNMGLGPNHDWASHAADAFGMMCMAYTNNNARSDWSKPLRRGLPVV